MAGLIGIVQEGGRAVPDRLLQRMRKRQVHHGTEGGVTRQGDITLAWSGRRDDTAWADDGLEVVIDGWTAFRDHHDTEPLGEAARVARAWRRWGIDLVRYVEGEFVVVILERAEGVVHVLRDAAGTRPLYWARAPGRVAFCSDIAPLLELSWVSRELARDHLSEYLAFRCVHAPRTLLRDVQQLPPGHRLRATTEGARVVRWHTPTYAAPGTAIPREQDVVPELTAAVERAVRRRLVGDRPVGVYLSGGVGSTSLVAAARSAARTLKTFTVAFAEEPFPESPFAGRVAQILGMEHHVVTVGSKEVAERFDDAIACLGHPIGNVATVLQLELAKAAALQVDTVLTGDGTDQLFGGGMLTRPAAMIRRSQAFHRLPSAVRAPITRALATFDRGHTVRTTPEEWPLAEGLGGVHLFDTRQRRTLLLDESLVRPSVRREVLEPFYKSVDTDILNSVLHAFFMSSLVADTLPRVESTAAAAGLSAGFPLLDREVQRLAQVLPGGFKVGGVGRADLPTRWLLRAALQGAVPSALVNRPDRGLPRPLDDWLTGAGRLFLEDRFTLLRRDPLELFHTTALEGLKRGLGRTPGATQRLWSLLILDGWIRAIGAT
ncbi:MAG: hypothetical protein H6733_13265 [Alphaproteobacteria bacterium]|nr:hypothetical protein [Alphaproteobacteria bacterium]